jgi:N utilization substance protein B
VPGPERQARARADARLGRRLCLESVFEADFGQRTSLRVLERRIADEQASPGAAGHARLLVDAVTRYRDSIDARIEQLAPAYPVVQLARIDRALLRSAMGELLHCPATPTRVAIAEWVELARTYSGEPARRLLNGVLGRVARQATGGDGPDGSPPTTNTAGDGVITDREEGAPT